METKIEKKKIFDAFDKETPKKRKFLDCLKVIGLCTLGIMVPVLYGKLKLIPSPLLMTPVDVYGEMTNPSLIRFILLFVDFVFVIVLSIFSFRFLRKNHLFVSTLFSYTAGVFLWQFLGEYFWHFGAFRIEVAPAIPIAMALCVILVYCNNKKAFSWPILVLIISFMSNWLSHLCMLGPSYFLINYIPENTSFLIFGSLFSIVFLIYSLYRLIFRTSNLEERIVSSMGVFISIATFACALRYGL